VTPADRANATGTVIAWFVAQARLLLLVFGAGQYFTNTSSVGILVTGNTDVCHSKLAIRGANTAAKVVETVTAYWIPEETVLFTVFGFFMTSVKGRVTDAAAIRIWLTTVGPVITEASGTFLPANGSITAISFFARVVAKSTVFFCVFGEPAIARSYW